MIHALNSIHEAPLQRVALKNDLEFHYVEEGAGAPLILLHGVLGDWSSWTHQWPLLTPHFRTISYSRRYNWPNQNAHPQADHSALIEAEDLSQLMDVWKTGPAVLVGASYGAYTALALAVKHPEKVRGLVLIEPPMLRWAELSEVGKKARESFEQDVRLPALAAFQNGQTELGVHMLTGGIVGDQLMQKLPASVMQKRLDNAKSIEMLTLSTDEFPWISPEQVQSISVPVLLMSGQQTPPIHETVFTNLTTRMPKASAVRVPNSGHAVSRDNPEEFNRLTEAFLKGHQLWG